MFSSSVAAFILIADCLFEQAKAKICAYFKLLCFHILFFSIFFRVARVDMWQTPYCENACYV